MACMERQISVDIDNFLLVTILIIHIERKLLDLLSIESDRRPTRCSQRDRV